MSETLLLLTTVGLLDSLSMLPLCIVPLSILMAGLRPLSDSLMFILGIFVTYFPFGLLLLFGLDSAFDTLAGWLSDLWNQVPTAPSLLVQIVLGLVMVIFGFRIAGRRESHGERGTRRAMTPVQAFVAGASLNLAGMWGALPYFAVINRVARAEQGLFVSVTALLYYNLVFIFPLLVFVGLGMLIGERAQQWFESLTGFFLAWGRRLIIAILVVLGAVLVADATGWFFNRPLLPVSDEVLRQLPGQAGAYGR